MGISDAILHLKEENVLLKSSSFTDETFKLIKSVPPSGMCRVYNIYVNPDTQKLIVDYETTPEP